MKKVLVGLSETAPIMPCRAVPCRAICHIFLCFGKKNDAGFIGPPTPAYTTARLNR